MNSNIEPNSPEPSGELVTTIRDFRSAVEHIAARETARPLPADWLEPARRRRRRAHHSMILAWASAALLCLAMLPLSVDSHRAKVAPPAAGSVAAPAPESDSALLEQVDMNVSESVPSPLAPLAELENWSSASTNTSNDSSANGTSLK